MGYGKYSTHIHIEAKTLPLSLFLLSAIVSPVARRRQYRGISFSNHVFLVYIVVLYSCMVDKCIPETTITTRHRPRVK